MEKIAFKSGMKKEGVMDDDSGEDDDGSVDDFCEIDTSSVEWG